MATLTFIPAHPATHREALLELNIEYLRWVLAGFGKMTGASAPFMQSAQRIYEQFGFVDRGPYEEVEAPKELHPFVRFMEKTLTV